MSGRNVVSIQQHRRARRLAIDRGMVAMMVIVAAEATMFIGMVTAFLVTRVVDGTAWPPPDQPWFPLGKTAINTTALLVSGALVLRAARNWDNREARLGPLLMAAIILGAFFLFFQGLVWSNLIRDGLILSSSLPGVFFCIIIGMHGLHTLATLALLSVIWLRLEPFREDVPTRAALSASAFSAASIAWYFAVGIWPVLWGCLYV